ncbi:YccF domain-containing protein [uncultured Subdoligranulum sp.]|uniref:YccF domain-containing protein n=1 Tax=uncultured Subdoligranulum sp. TaxID=512298 RepID=UPI00260CB575|nr:YccF domain-containing protein [uncultured Subdoligranulum sp.]
MRFLGNLLWCLFGGLFSALSWTLAGLFWCITIVGIPVGMQCFKFANLSLFPFGKEILYAGGAPSLLFNLLWLLLSGLPLAISHAIWGCVLCLTIVGIPFGLQFFKIARLALFPFGSRVVVTA